MIGGGQSGLAMTHALQTYGANPLLLEAGPEPVGSWPRYHDSLVLLSPARYSALPGHVFPGDPERYPHRDEVIDYLRGYAARLRGDIRTRHRVSAVHRHRRAFAVEVDDGHVFTARVVVAATGTFGNPYQPRLRALDAFTGSVLHAAAYREPSRFADQRIVVVGAGNSAVQIAAELSGRARVTLATRRPIRLVPQRLLGRDVRAWSAGVDALPVGRFLHTPPTAPVLDPGVYRRAIRSGRLERRKLFVAAHGSALWWPDGSREHVDTVILATGYRPDVGYLAPLGTLNHDGRPRQVNGLSTTHAGLGFIGMEWQRSAASASLRGVARDARYLARRLLRARRA